MTYLIESEEREIKLVPTEVTQAKLLNCHRRRIDEVDDVLQIIKAALSLAEFKITQESVENIVDQYFDTRNLVLFEIHASLRIRRVGASIELTIKKPKEQERGQFTRSEFSKIISETEYRELLDDGFRKVTKTLLLDVTNERMSNILQVNNERRKFTLCRRDEKYELSLDLMQFVDLNSKKVSNPESEIEIEALNEIAKQKLGTIRRNLVDIMKTFEFSKDSKYERGITRLSISSKKNRSAKAWFLKKNTESVRAWITIILTIIGLIVAVVGMRCGK